MNPEEIAGPELPQFRFHDGLLHIEAGDRAMKLRAWPDPEAWLQTKGAGWQQFFPAFRLLKPAPDSGAGTPPDESPLVHQSKESAFAGLRAPMPPLVASAVERIQCCQWNLIDLISRKQEALDLLSINPALAFCLANCDQFRHRFYSTPAAQASRLIGRRQREILGWLGFPPTEAVVGIFRKITPEAVSPSEVRMLGHALKAEAQVQKLLSHQPVVNTGVLGLVTNLKLLSGVTPNLLTEVGVDDREAAFPHTAALLLDILWMLLELHRMPGLPPFDSIASVRQHHETLSVEHQRALEELRRQRAEARRRRPVAGKRPGDGYPPPPLPGTEDIVPLTSVARLREEGTIQRNCVGTYARRVQSGSIYVYKVLRPERATLSIQKNAWGGWSIAELEIAGNRRVQGFTRAAVQRWLGMHSLSI